MPQPNSETATIRVERIRNYLRVVHSLVGHDVEELTREVSFTIEFHDDAPSRMGSSLGERGQP